MRVAVLADIHGNLPALDAVLADVLGAGADAVVLNGDIADGPLPAATLDRLADLGERAIWVRGNGDRWTLEAYDGVYQPSGTPTDALIEWSAAQLDQRQRDLLAGGRHTVTLEVDGLGPVAFHHGTARDDNEIVLVDSPIERYAAAFADVTAATVVLGHTHMPFDRLVDRRRFVNPGSVGMPYGHVGAAWALLGPDVVLRRTSYDVAAAARTLRAQSSMPDLDAFLAENLRQAPSDAEALAVFTELSRGQPSRG